MRDTELLIDQATGAIVESIDSTLTAQPERFVFGDNLGISVTPLERNTGFDAADKPWRLIDMSNKTIKVAIGTKERTPTNGTFNINTIDDIAYNVSGEDLETALNTDATITSEGGCKVSALSKGGWKVTFLTLGAKTALTSSTNDLTPTATLSIDTINAGGASEFAAFFIRTETNAASSGTLLNDIDSLTYTVATIQAPDAATNQPAIYSFELVGLPVGGTFSIGLDSAFTRQIGYDADSEEINEALIQLTQLASADSVSVEGSSKSFAVSISPDVSAFTASADVTNLQGLNGKQGELNINTVEMIELLNGNSTAQGTFEIVLDDSAGTSKTIHQSSVEIAQDVISSNAPAPSPLIEYALKSDLDALQVEVDAIEARDWVEVPAGSVNGFTPSNGYPAFVVSVLFTLNGTAEFFPENIGSLIVDDRPSIQYGHGSATIRTFNSVQFNRRYISRWTGSTWGDWNQLANADEVVDLTTAQTAAGEKTFTDELRATGQTAVEGSSVMTRELVDERDFLGLVNIWSPPYSRYQVANNGTGSSAITVSSNGVLLQSGTATNGYGRVRFLTEPVGASYYLPLTRPCGVAINFVYAQTSVTATNAVFRLLYGTQTAVQSADANALTVSGFGCEITSDGTNHKIRAVTHDGTIYTAGTWVNFATGDNRQGNRVLAVETDGVGNITAKISGDHGAKPFIEATTTGGPTSDGSGINAQVTAHCAGDSTITPTQTTVYIRAVKIKSF